MLAKRTPNLYVDDTQAYTFPVDHFRNANELLSLLMDELSVGTEPYVVVHRETFVKRLSMLSHELWQANHEKTHNGH